MDGSKSPERLKANRRKWKKWVQAWQQSNQSVALFCRENHLSIPAFYYWRSKLLTHSEAIENKDKAPVTLSQALSFIPVELQHEPEFSKSTGMALHYPNGCFLRLEQDCDPKLLRLIHETMGVILC